MAAAECRRIAVTVNSFAIAASVIDNRLQSL
jgi:hypothetical protein